MKKTCLFLVLFLVNIQVLLTVNLELKREAIFTLGEKEISFDSITSVCEDRERNIYVLDNKAYKVYKFSKDGKYLLSFGNRGQGPQDFIAPHTVHLSPEGNLVVSEIRDFVSIFDTTGKLLEHIKVSKGLDVSFINRDLFYCWTWGKHATQQLLIDEKGNTVKPFYSIDFDRFSVSLPDETGRMVMFNYFAEEYTPFFVFNQYKNYAAIGISNRYEIHILGNDGKIQGKITNNMKVGAISPEERKHLANLINEYTKLPERLKKVFIKRIPRVKNYFNQFLLSDRFIWVFRVKNDITKEDCGILTDLYSYKLEPIGTLLVRETPVFISDEYMYTIRTNEEEALLLVKYKYLVE